MVAIGLLSTPGVKAQVYAHFDRDTITVDPGHTFINVLRLRNNDATPTTLQLSISDSTVGGSMLTLPATITLAPKEEKAFPLKYLATSTTIRERIQPFVVRYDNIETKFYTRLVETPRVLLQTTTPTLFFDPHTHKTTAAFTLVNEGLLPLHLRLQLDAFPANLQLTGDRQPFTLAAGGRRTINYDIQAPGRHPADYAITAQCVDDSGMSYATTDIRIESLGSNKQVAAPGAETPAGNALELNYITMSPYYAYWQLRAQGGTGLPDSSLLRYKATVEYYDHPHGAMIYDSWLAYTAPHFGVRFGGINDNLDYPINGNGMQASLFVDSTHTVDVFGLRNTYVLYTDVTSQLPGADLIAGRYTYHTKPFGLQISLLHASDPVYQVYTNLLHTEARWQPSPTQELAAEGGFSTETPQDANTYHLGYAAGLRYRAQWPRLSLLLNNYYSSPYYGGYRRGAIQLDDEADWSTGEKDQVFARYSKAYNAPKYTPGADSLVLLPFDYNNTDIYELGYRFHAGASSITLHPYEMDQRLYSALASADVSLKSNSHRGALDYRYGHKGTNLFIGLDGGYTRSDSLGKSAGNYSSWRVMGNLSGRFWDINGLLQEHPYYLTDQLQSPNPENFRLYSIGPGIHLSFLQDRLLVAGGYTLSYYSVSHITTQLINAHAEYRFNDNWKATGQLYYTLYRAGTLPYPASREIRIGVAKNFLGGRSVGTIHLRLLLFEDKNSNGTVDPGEHAAAGVIVRLDGLSAVSDAKGEVVFTNLPRGIHSLTVDNSPEWNLPEPMSLAVLRDRTLDIPLVVSGVVNGRVFIERQQYEHRETDPEGIRVEAEAANGKVFVTYTDAGGRFRFYLPRAEYVLTVHAQGAVNIGAVSQRLIVGPGGAARIDFHLQDRRRNIEVRQF